MFLCSFYVCNFSKKTYIPRTARPQTPILYPQTPILYPQTTLVCYCEKNKKIFSETDCGGGGYGGATPPRARILPQSARRAALHQPKTSHGGPPGLFSGIFSTNETNLPTMERDFCISFSYNFRGIIRSLF